VVNGSNKITKGTIGFRLKRRKTVKMNGVMKDLRIFEIQNW
jgi:hypothetical protein